MSRIDMVSRSWFWRPDVDDPDVFPPWLNVCSRQGEACETIDIEGHHGGPVDLCDPNMLDVESGFVFRGDEPRLPPSQALRLHHR